ncbi:MAG TPA: PaaI family thioesterase [Acidimicrobiales bacterium]|jgi:uncharacterized protein (TIGR00369 family)|nr:PaaI family thioesterase [Acidimicrobiales bacterium]
MADGPTMSDEDQVAYRKAIPDVMGSTPYLSGLGLVFDRYEPDEVTLRLPFRAELTNDGHVYHGGVIATVMDTAGAAAAWSNHDFSKGTRASTVSMSLQYVGVCKGTDLVVHARAVKRGRELTFCEMTATDPDGTPVAHGHLTYRIV